METVHPLKAYRTREKLTQQGAAQQVKVSRETWARWEAGRFPDRTLVPTIAAKTGIPAKVLRPDLAETLGVEQ